MDQVTRLWLGHPAVRLYLAVFFALFFYLAAHRVLLTHSPLILTLLIAPFYEWLVHRYLLHARGKSEVPWFRNFMERLHRDHHKDPDNIEMAFAPWYIGLMVPLKFFLVGLVFAHDSFYPAAYLAMLSMAYYLFYEWTHLAHHLKSYQPVTARGRRLKRAHQWHHFRNENYWWGVTSTFGDRALGTLVHPQKVDRQVLMRETGA